MSKERLEEAKLMAEMLRVETRLPHDFPFDLVDWLVEQAERVQELEKQNKRYREAIERALDESGWGDEGNALHKMISILAKALEESE